MLFLQEQTECTQMYALDVTYLSLFILYLKICITLFIFTSF